MTGIYLCGVIFLRPCLTNTRLWQKLLIYRCNETANDAFPSRRAATVEVLMKKAWTTSGIAYQQLVNNIHVLISLAVVVGSIH